MYIHIISILYIYSTVYTYIYIVLYIHIYIYHFLWWNWMQFGMLEFDHSSGNHLWWPTTGPLGRSVPESYDIHHPTIAECVCMYICGYTYIIIRVCICIYIYIIHIYICVYAISSSQAMHVVVDQVSSISRSKNHLPFSPWAPLKCSETVLINKPPWIISG